MTESTTPNPETPGKPETPKPDRGNTVKRTTREDKRRPKGTKSRGERRREQRVRTIGTNVGQAIRDAQAARDAAERRERAAIARRIAGGNA